ncbi:MAG: TOMM system kinase/cyclase fusion protein [Arenicella sp.]
MTNNLSVESRLMSTFQSPDYRLLEKVGEGGFGQVYKAEHIKTGQIVAIKCLMISSESDVEKRTRYITRFEREMLLCSKLQQHPNIVKLLDKGQSEDGLIYAVFEFVEGQSLKEYLFKKGPLVPTEAVDIMSQVLDALAHAHAQGIVHRDIKPANIMLNQTGTKVHAKILDFGIGALSNEARQLDYKSLTLTQETLGTPSYSAPEQLRGEPPSPKTDLYVWGLVFIECLTGVPAVSGSSLASIFQKQLNSTSVPLPPALAGHPVATVLRRVLNKNIHERADSAATIYDEIGKLNVSNLVGKLGGAEHDSTAVNTYHVPTSHEQQLDETLINQNDFLYSGLTERKQITVMCIRLNVQAVDADHGDSEIIHALHRDQKTQCVDIVTRYGAMHVGTLGDTLLFYFGFPTVSDNDCRLCARASLEFISHLNKRNALLRDSQGVINNAYIGIHSGLITVYADSIPEGDTPNIAMDLSRKAEANQIVCSEATRKLLEGYIEFEAYQVQVLGVNAKKIPLYTVTGERLVEAFGFLRGNRRQHNAFIGRNEELSQLERLLTQNSTKSASLRAVHIYGEAGIGKSRLVSEFRRKLSSSAHLVAQCLPEQINNALFPVLNLLKYQYSFNVLNEQEIIECLETSLSKQTEINQQQALSILCSWLNLSDNADSAELSSLTPEQLKYLLFDALAFLLSHGDSAELSEKNEKRLFIFEDIHWSDPTSLEFIDHFISSDYFNDGFISTSRQVLPDRLDVYAHQTIEIQKLTQEYTTEFIHYLFDQQQVSQKVIELIISRTDGIPLFIEEFTNMLEQKQFVQHVNGKIELMSTDRITELPRSLRDSLQQNLDQLNNGKEIAQLASAIGREFSHEFILQSCQRDEAWLQTELNELLQAELIYVQRRTSGDSYIFKHALVRDAAYDSMPLKRKQYAHQQIAESLEQQKESIKNNAALLATHWAEAAVYEKSVHYGNMAANAALKRSSSNEAILQAEKVQLWISYLDRDQQTDHLLDNYSLLTSAYMEAKGWGSTEVLQYSQKSLDLLASTERYDELVSHLWWKVLNGIVGGRRKGLSNLCSEMEKIVDLVSDMNRAAIKCAQGFYHFTQGDRNASIEALNASIEFYDDEADKNHQQTFGFDVGVFAKATIARAYADQNQDKKSLHYSALALDEAKDSEHVPSIGIALMYHGLVHQHYQNKTEVEQSASELIALSEQYDLPIYKGFGQMLFDWSQDDVSRADQVLQTLSEAGSKHGLGHFQSFYADIYAQQQQYTLAVNKIDQCIEMDNAIDEPNYLTYLLFKKAGYLMQLQVQDGSDNHQDTINHLNGKAKAIASQQGVLFITDALSHIPIKPIDIAL